MDELAKWLKCRSQLSKAQVQALIKSFKKVVREFQLQGVFDTGQNDYHQEIKKRLTEEETAITLSGNNLGIDMSMTGNESDEE